MVSFLHHDREITGLKHIFYIKKRLSFFYDLVFNYHMPFTPKWIHSHEHKVAMSQYSKAEPVYIKNQSICRPWVIYNMADIFSHKLIKCYMDSHDKYIYLRSAWCFSVWTITICWSFCLFILKLYRENLKVTLWRVSTNMTKGGLKGNVFSESYTILCPVISEKHVQDLHTEINMHVTMLCYSHARAFEDKCACNHKMHGCAARLPLLINIANECKS